MIVVTGATGHLGRLVITGLLQHFPANRIIAAVRSAEKAKDLAAEGVQVREADYSRPGTLAAAFAGATKFLLISSSDLGQRETQHQAVIDAAQAAGTRFLCYTSVLHADSSTLILAGEHFATGQHLRASGIPFAMLRNGWYIENQTAGIAAALQQGAFVGASKYGHFAAATRADYAAAAVAVLSHDGYQNQVFELAGDHPYTRAELAEEVSKQTGRTIPYQNLPQAEYEKILVNFLPPALAQVTADAEAKAADGALDDHSHTLSSLIGRATVPLADAVAAALKELR